MADANPQASVVPLTQEAAAQLLRDAAATHNQNLAQILVAAQSLHRPSSSLRSQDVGYFDPSAEDPDGIGMIADGEITKFTDVFVFAERLQHLAKANSEEEVRRVWTQCLMGPALLWHSQILSPTDRELLQTASVALICNKLTDRFKPSWATAFQRLKSTRLTLDDIHRGHDIQIFAQRVIRHAKNCDQPYPNQLKAVFTAFDSDIQSQLTMPTEATTLDEFTTQLREREPVLQQMAATKARQRIPPPRYGQRFNPQRPYLQ
ncbi:hypothetical protein GGR50DRAFT_518867 [Xylaria sp. CBS 124048]|nr:hypothetical protein GGR50DRAFT_518867 [Xylaria sp. CBS 124048]